MSVTAAPEMGNRHALFRFGLAVAALVMLADQASKLYLLFWTELLWTHPWRVLPIMDFTVVWNRGISYGLFQQETELGRYALIGFKILAATLLAVWMRRTHSRAEAGGLGLIIGGALGNAVDRAVHGAVFDFVHMHVGRFSWYVFNLADAAVVVGVGLLLYAHARFRT